MGIEKKTYSIRLEEEIVEKVKAYARQENRNFSNMVETILLQYITHREAKEAESEKKT